MIICLGEWFVQGHSASKSKSKLNLDSRSRALYGVSIYFDVNTVYLMSDETGLKKPCSSSSDRHSICRNCSFYSSSTEICQEVRLEGRKKKEGRREGRNSWKECCLV